MVAYPARYSFHLEASNLKTQACPCLTVISYDHYPFSVFYEGGTLEAFRFFYENFSIVYKNAKKYNMPIWAFIQAGGFFGAFKKDITCEYYPSPAELLWLVNVSLHNMC